MLPEAEDEVEKAATDDFKNVSSIRVREALEAAANQLAGIGVAVSGMAATTILSGALVLLAAITANRRSQQYDAVIFKILGAKICNLGASGCMLGNSPHIAKLLSITANWVGRGLPYKPLTPKP